MTPQVFMQGMAHLETFFHQKLSPQERVEYQKALAVLTDQQWRTVVSYATAVWKFGSVPRPGNFLEWCGISLPSPAEENSRTKLDGAPLVGGVPLERALDQAAGEGRGEYGVEPEKTAEAFLPAVRAVLSEAPPPPRMSTEHVFARVKEIAKRATTSAPDTERSQHAAPYPDDHDSRTPGDDG
jgi:hypothetical protein